MKNKGTTLIELMVALVILGIIAGVVARIINNSSKVQLKKASYENIDRSAGRTIELIKRAVRASIETGTLGLDSRSSFMVYTDTTSTGVSTATSNVAGVDYEEGTAVTVNTSNMGNISLVTFYYDAANSQILVKDGGVTSGSASQMLSENVTSCQFRSDRGINTILTIDIEITVNDRSNSTANGILVKSIKDVAVSRSRLQ